MKFISELYCSEPYLGTASKVNLFLSDTYREKILSAMKFIEENGADAVTFWCAADWILLDEEGEQHIPTDHGVEQCNLKVMRRCFRFVLNIANSTETYDTDILTFEDEVK